MDDRRPERPPIELVAARLREARRTAGILRSSPDLVSGRDDEIERHTAIYDEWLIVAAEQVGIAAQPLDSAGPGLPARVRRRLERSIADAGWLLD